MFAIYRHNAISAVNKKNEIMLEEGQGQVNFTTLLTLFGDRLNGTDEENVILNAWKNFDAEGNGQINQKR